IDGSTKQQIDLKTSYFDGGLPNARKDVQVVKIHADTGDALVNIQLAKDGGDIVEDFGDHRFNGATLLTLAPNTDDTVGINLGRSFQLRITSLADGVTTFKFLHWSIDYEPRPEQLNVVRVLPTNFGSAGRKRFYSLSFSLNAFKNTCTVTPILDAVRQTQAAKTFTGIADEKFLQLLSFNPNLTGRELGLEIVVDSPDNGVIEFYEVIVPKVIEVLPDRTKHYVIPQTDLGNPARKGFVRVAIDINTFGKNVTFIPLIDGSPQKASVINTRVRKLYLHYFNKDTKGIQLGGTFQTSEDTAFELYGIDAANSVFDVLPLPSAFIRGKTDFNSASRKRFSRISFVCDFKGLLGTFTPILDGVRQPGVSFSGSGKRTHSYYFNETKIFVDLEYELKSNSSQRDFEFYSILKPEILEIIPEPVKFYTTPTTNLGTTSRKRFIAFAIIIGTRNGDVTLTPFIDGVSQTPSTVNTSRKTTVLHYFNPSVEGTDIFATLESTENVEFEVYDIDLQESISEKLPPLATYLEIPPSNFGVAGKKRIRTMPFEINTRGGTVTFTPKVDGVVKTASTHSSSEKRTKLHLFATDVFGIDYGGTLSSDDPFEFYGLQSPENVQLLPVAKVFDQIGPFSLDRGAWFKELRLRIVPTGSLITWTLYLSDTQEDTGSIITTPDVEKVYEVYFTRAVKGTVVRLELASDDAFHRIGGEIRYGDSGGATALKKFKFTNEMSQWNRT
ncbi:hypothetical protein LCGC14_1819140, partial [marine sediment metagenome]